MLSWVWFCILVGAAQSATESSAKLPQVEAAHISSVPAGSLEIPSPKHPIQLEGLPQEQKGNASDASIFQEGSQNNTTQEIRTINNVGSEAPKNEESTMSNVNSSLPVSGSTSAGNSYSHQISATETTLSTSRSAVLDFKSPVKTPTPADDLPKVSESATYSSTLMDLTSDGMRPTHSHTPQTQTSNLPSTTQADTSDRVESSLTSKATPESDSSDTSTQISSFITPSEATPTQSAQLTSDIASATIKPTAPSSGQLQGTGTSFQITLNTGKTLDSLGTPLSTSSITLTSSEEPTVQLTNPPYLSSKSSFITSPSNHPALQTQAYDSTELAHGRKSTGTLVKESTLQHESGSTQKSQTQGIESPSQYSLFTQTGSSDREKASKTEDSPTGADAHNSSTYSSVLDDLKQNTSDTELASQPTQANVYPTLPPRSSGGSHKGDAYLSHYTFPVSSGSAAIKPTMTLNPNQPEKSYLLNPTKTLTGSSIQSSNSDESQTSSKSLQIPSTAILSMTLTSSNPLDHSLDNETTVSPSGKVPSTISTGLEPTSIKHTPSHSQDQTLSFSSSASSSSRKSGVFSNPASPTTEYSRLITSTEDSIVSSSESTLDKSIFSSITEPASLPPVNSAQSGTRSSSTELPSSSNQLTTQPTTKTSFLTTPTSTVDPGTSPSTLPANSAIATGTDARISTSTSLYSAIPSTSPFSSATYNPSLAPTNTHSLPKQNQSTITTYPGLPTYTLEPSSATLETPSSTTGSSNPRQLPSLTSTSIHGEYGSMFVTLPTTAIFSTSTSREFTSHSSGLASNPLESLFTKTTSTLELSSPTLETPSSATESRSPSHLPSPTSSKKGNSDSISVPSSTITISSTSSSRELTPNSSGLGLKPTSTLVSSIHHSGLATSTRTVPTSTKISAPSEASVTHAPAQYVPPIETTAVRPEYLHTTKEVPLFTTREPLATLTLDFTSPTYNRGIVVETTSFIQGLPPVPTSQYVLTYPTYLPTNVMLDATQSSISTYAVLGTNRPQYITGASVPPPSQSMCRQMLVRLAGIDYRSLIAGPDASKWLIVGLPQDLGRILAAPASASFVVNWIAPHNPESLHSDRSVVVGVSLPQDPEPCKLRSQLNDIMAKDPSRLKSTLILKYADPKWGAPDPSKSDWSANLPPTLMAPQASGLSIYAGVPNPFAPVLLGSPNSSENSPINLTQSTLGWAWVGGLTFFSTLGYALLARFVR